MSPFCRVLASFALKYDVIGWDQIDEHLVQQCGRTKAEPFDIQSQQCGNMINMIIQNLYFGFCQTFQPNKFVRDDVHRN